MLYLRRLALVLFGLPCVAQTPANRDSMRLFVDRLYPVLERAECRACHNEHGVSSATRLLFPPAGSDTVTVQAFGLKLSALVDRGNPQRSLLLTKPTQRIPHAGGQRIAKNSPGDAALNEWVQYLAALPERKLRASLDRLDGSQKKAARPGALRRLTHSQYNNTVRDLLGDITRPADHFPQEDYLNGFTNQVEGQSIPPALAEAYTLAAEKLAGSAFKHGDTNSLFPCKPASATDAVCRDEFIRQFGLRAFRRPLTPAEVKGYGGFFARAEGFNAGAALVVEAMLQSPSFLFHLQPGSDERMRQYGMASRLSYFLWDTAPNADIYRAVEAGELKDREGIRKLAMRMMEDPQTSRSLDRFLAQWMRFDRVMASARSVRRYPDFGPSLLSAMTEETRHLFNHLVWNDKDFTEFFSAGYTFLSGRLAQLYGFQAPEKDYEPVPYPADSKRAGVLGHAGVLTGTANPNETSPTARGLFVREHFLCQSVPPPPPGVDTTLPAVSPDKPMTTRERLAIHTTNASCASCHRLIDPIGHGLEGFDNIGRFREKVTIRIQEQRDAVTNARIPAKNIDLPLDTKGSIQGIPNSDFASAAELGNILAKDPTCQKCVVKQIFRYALGRLETPADQPIIDELYRKFKESGFRFRELLLELVTSEPFLIAASNQER